MPEMIALRVRTGGIVLAAFAVCIAACTGTLAFRGEIPTLTASGSTMQLRRSRKLSDDSVIAVSSSASMQLASLKTCEFGTLPGHWVGNRWTLYDEECQLRDLVEARLARHDEGEPLPEVGILLIGDSVDRMVVELGCPLAPSMAAPNEEAPAFRCRFCQLHGTTLANYPIWGIFSEGPFLEDRTHSAETRVPMALELFRNATLGDPDMVVLSSNFWDIGAMRVRSPEIDAQDDLPEHFVAAWQRDAAAIFQLVQELVPPSTVLVWHTMHYPKTDPETGRHWLDSGTWHAHVAQLNALGRYVASQFPRWHVVDLELMASRWHEEDDYFLRDRVHPNVLLTHQTLNIYLNLLRAERDSMLVLATGKLDGSPSGNLPADEVGDSEEVVSAALEASGLAERQESIAPADEVEGVEGLGDETLDLEGNDEAATSK